MDKWDERIKKIQEIISSVSPLKWIHENGEYTGKDWLIASIYFGTSGIDSKEHVIHITTDHVHASENCGDAKGDAEYILEACNNYPDALNEIKHLRELGGELVNELRHRSMMAQWTLTDEDEEATGALIARAEQELG